MKATTYTINKSRLFKRAWYLVKTCGYSISNALKKVWSEMKAYAIEKTNESAYLESLKRPQIYTPWTPSPETMATYYGGGTYKGD